jgi:hypothetical protein
MRLTELLSSTPLLSQAGSRLVSDQTFYLGSYADRLATRPPKRVLAVVALPSLRTRTDTWTRLLAFGRYLRAYSIIEELAGTLATAVLDTGLVPLIVPIRDRDLLGMTLQTPFVQRTIARGVVLFDAARL